MSLQQLQLRTGIRPLTNSYYYTAVWLVKQISSCNSSLGLSTFTVYQCSGRDRPTRLHSTSSQRALSELQTLRRAKQYVPQDYKIHAPPKNQNAI